MPAMPLPPLSHGPASMPTPAARSQRFSLWRRAMRRTRRGRPWEQACPRGCGRRLASILVVARFARMPARRRCSPGGVSIAIMRIAGVKPSPTRPSARAVIPRSPNTDTSPANRHSGAHIHSRTASPPASVHRRTRRRQLGNYSPDPPGPRYESGSPGHLPTHCEPDRTARPSSACTPSGATPVQLEDRRPRPPQASRRGSPSPPASRVVRRPIERPVAVPAPRK